ncbi:MAG: hypothetical protein OEZ22_08350 [Spirochaetia bacterium]|nr:hypothetical protein [Spirochaetia bacterium]
MVRYCGIQIVILLTILLNHCTSSSLTSARTAKKSEGRLKLQAGKTEVYSYDGKIKNSIYNTDAAVSIVYAIPEIGLDLEYNTTGIKHGLGLKKFISEKPLPFSIRTAGEFMIGWKMNFVIGKTDIIMNFIESNFIFFGGLRSSYLRYNIFGDYNENTGNYSGGTLYSYIDTGIFSGVSYLDKVTIELGLSYIVNAKLKNMPEDSNRFCCWVPTIGFAVTSRIFR